MTQDFDESSGVVSLLLLKECFQGPAVPAANPHLNADEAAKSPDPSLEREELYLEEWLQANRVKSGCPSVKSRGRWHSGPIPLGFCTAPLEQTAHCHVRLN